MKPPTGQKLADAMAEMVGKKPHPRFNPQTDYNDCRIVMEWANKNGLGDAMRRMLEWDSPASEVCQAAWIIWKDSNVGRHSPTEKAS